MKDPYQQMKQKTPRPLWPWLVGGAAIAGGYAWMRNKRSISDLTMRSAPRPFDREVMEAKQKRDAAKTR